MRNLHLEGIRYNTLWFIEMLNSMGLDISPEQDMRAIRRFLLGQKMVAVAQPERMLVNRTAVVPVDGLDGCSIGEMQENVGSSLHSVLAEHNIESGLVTNLTIYADEVTRGLCAEVSYSSLESDGELAERQAFADKFNLLLANETQIYRAIDTRKVVA